jgi:hypothetical protein
MTTTPRVWKQLERSRRLVPTLGTLAAVWLQNYQKATQKAQRNPAVEPQRRDKMPGFD